MAKTEMTYNLTIVTKDAVSSMEDLTFRLKSACLNLPDEAREVVRDWLKSLMKIEFSAVQGLRSIADMEHVKPGPKCVGPYRCAPCRAEQALRDVGPTFPREDE